MQMCPCGTGKSYEMCCGVFISHKADPATPEELMRSRYTAYHDGNENYITETMKPPAATRSDPDTIRNRMQTIAWVKLEVLNSSQTNSKGTVEFRAHYTLEDKKNVLHEISEFRQDNGKWFYIDGTTPKSGRNDPCPCGSQKKYKKCCENSETQ